jgi:hypothetical protein
MISQRRDIHSPQKKRLEKKLSDGQMKMGRIVELIKKYIVHGHTLL